MDNICIGYILTKTQRLILGFFLLVLVDVIWVSTIELSKYLNRNDTLEKPFFATYVRSTMFSIYLLGFCFRLSWRQYCRKSQNYTIIDNETEDDSFTQECISTLSNPIYVPVKLSERENFSRSSGTESDDCSIKSVRFNKLAEVRQMSELEASEAMMARLPYRASLGTGEYKSKPSYRLAIWNVLKVAFVTGLFWFMANYSYVLALKTMQHDFVNFLSGIASLFTLVMCALFPVNQVDKFSLSKLLAVFISILGLGLVIYSKFSVGSFFVPQGVLLSLLHAFFTSLYVVYLRHKIDHEDNIDIPLFYGFIGLINLFTLWPVILFLNLNNCELIEWPTKNQWSHMLINGIIGSVISELLWIWGAFLTSPLLAIIMISLINPFSMITDIILEKIVHPELFYIGLVLMILAVVIIVILIQYENRDPVLNVLHCAYRILLKNRFKSFLNNISEENSEQTEALIGESCEA